MAKTSKHIGAGDKRAKTRLKTPTKVQNDMFTFCIKQKIGVECVREHRFHPDRLWRFDYAIPSLRIAIEIDGGVWINGRHNRASGYLGDMEKFNAAATLGWVVLIHSMRSLADCHALNCAELAVFPQTTSHP